VSVRPLPSPFLSLQSEDEEGAGVDVEEDDRLKEDRSSRASRTIDEKLFYRHIFCAKLAQLAKMR